MAQFICLFHAPHFLQACLPTAAPRLDLQLWKDMSTYQRVEPDIATQVRESILRHQWYLTEELVILSLFDKGLSDQSKGEVASALLQEERMAEFAPGKPKFGNVLETNDDIKLAMFVGKRSNASISLARC